MAASGELAGNLRLSVPAGPSLVCAFMIDEHSLDRFVEVQILTYAPALAEIRRGVKRTHWMWWIFPQLTDLGRSPTTQQFAIRSVKVARAYPEDRKRVGSGKRCAVRDESGGRRVIKKKKH